MLFKINSKFHNFVIHIYLKFELLNEALTNRFMQNLLSHKILESYLQLKKYSFSCKKKRIFINFGHVYIYLT